MRFRIVVVTLLLAAAGLAFYRQRAAVRQWAFEVTGEEQLGGQALGLLELAGSFVRPPLDLRPDAPMQYNGVNPFGINTFLEQEVEPAKRERQAALIADAGFHWIRQEFPWYDLEVHGKSDFADCRLPPCRSSWEKYDAIVSLAEAHGLEIIARLSSPPDWSRAAGGTQGAFLPPDNFTDFADYAAAVAARYRGRVHYYQVWNEPNIYPEWGDQPADPEAYTRLLCETFARLKAVDPAIVVLSGVLAPTNELGAFDPNGTGATNLNEFVFLQRMYRAGARDCFDVLTVQGYGLWSGPTDRRVRPLTTNYARHQLLRDLMVRNGDEHKAIWIAEMNWNSVPPGSGIAPNFGQVTEAQQARYAPLAYQRAQAEWPWIGVNLFWFFKRAGDSEKNQAWYYFRMAEPDFTLLPVYETMKATMHQTPVMYPGWFQEDHWAVTWGPGWVSATDPGATFGVFRAPTRPGALLNFTFAGTDLSLVTYRGPRAGTLAVRVDGGLAQTFDLRRDAPEFQYPLALARGLRDGQHAIEIASVSGDNFVDGFIVRRAPERTGALLAVLTAGLAAAWYVARRAVAQTPHTG